MKTDTPKTIYLKDYKPFPYTLSHVDLNFDLRDGETVVTAKSLYLKKPGGSEALFLNGEHLVLRSVKLDGRTLSHKDYRLDEKGLTLPCPGAAAFTLEIETVIAPERNTRLEGLYMSGGNYCTQCEAEGFRCITYYPDRPDVLATFTTRVEADREKYPVLLSNGNKTEGGNAQGGRHYAVWNDPFPKPCYLFALVAGNLTHIQDRFTTKSGRNVDLYIYVRPGDEKQCDHAMQSLKRSMKWDEEAYGLEYDLDLFNIVAVSDFNMGAMENKSLNIFNTALVLAHQDTATDADFLRIESVIAHEYFHNWSGNRVTCRDWFQLSLKEGLTVFRDQEFSADLNSRVVQRIDDVTHLRRMQFPEDAGPLAHPIRPDNYIEINNFYTMTVYEKGAEVIRMMHTILGPENYRKGTDLYFSRHDGQAATCEDFVACMEEASGIDLAQFRLWYSQAGTPEVTFKGEYDAAAKIYNIHLTQKTRHGKAMHIPVLLSLLPSTSSRRKPGSSDSKAKDPGFRRDDILLLNLKEHEQTFTFENIPSKPIPSILQNFSAPVILKTDQSDADLAHLMVYDTDGFNRWQAGQDLALRALHHMIDKAGHVPEIFLQSYGALLKQALEKDADKDFMARAIQIPDIAIIGLERNPVDPQAIYQARETILEILIDRFGDSLHAIYEGNRTPHTFSITPDAMGQRALQNTALGILSKRRTDEDDRRALAHYTAANNMTDRMAALMIAQICDGEAHAFVMNDFYKQYRDYPLVIDKWFAVQAGTPRRDIMQILERLRAHPDFNIRNPNRVRALYSAFANGNPVCFHAADGSGYHFLTQGIIDLNVINPQIAARLLGPMRDWRRYTADRQEKIKLCLEEILKTPNLSPDVFEIASKSL